jgi:hypothetical protein
MPLVKVPSADRVRDDAVSHKGADRVTGPVSREAADRTVLVPSVRSTDPVWGPRVCREVQERGRVYVSFRDVRRALATRYRVGEGDAHRHVLAACAAQLVYVPNPDDDGPRKRLSLRMAGRKLLAEEAAWDEAQAKKIGAAHEAGQAAARRSLEWYYAAGRALIETRDECKRRGESFTEWLDKHRHVTKVGRARAYHYIAWAEYLVTRRGAVTEEEAEAEWRRISGNENKSGPGEPDIPQDGDEGDDLPATDDLPPADKNHLRLFSVPMTLAAFETSKERVKWLKPARGYNSDGEVVADALRVLDEQTPRPSEGGTESSSSARTPKGKGANDG